MTTGEKIWSEQSTQYYDEGESYKQGVYEVYASDIIEAIDKAIKDERNKVIEEIEPILKKIWELAYGKTVNYIQLRNDLRAEYKKLNSLKNP
jgi:peptide methionine sulfoxide reductase MsrA